MALALNVNNFAAKLKRPPITGVAFSPNFASAFANLLWPVHLF